MPRPARRALRALLGRACFGQSLRGAARLPPRERDGVQARSAALACRAGAAGAAGAAAPRGLTRAARAQIVTVFFGTLVAGSIASQIKVFVEQPATFLQTLGTAAPMTSIFFLTYVETNVRPSCALGGRPLACRLSLARRRLLLARQQARKAGLLGDWEPVQVHLGVRGCLARSRSLRRASMAATRAQRGGRDARPARGPLRACVRRGGGRGRAQALAITPIMFLNLPSLVIFWVLSFFAATERAKARLWQNQFMSYGSKARPRARRRRSRARHAAEETAPACQRAGSHGGVQAAAPVPLCHLGSLPRPCPIPCAALLGQQSAAADAGRARAVSCVRHGRRACVQEASGCRVAQVPTHTITILLGLTFCCMNPLLPPMALVYFLVNTVTEKYNMLYVMRARFQSGGRARGPARRALPPAPPGVAGRRAWPAVAGLLLPAAARRAPWQQPRTMPRRCLAVRGAGGHARGWLPWRRNGVRVEAQGAEARACAGRQIWTMFFYQVIAALIIFQLAMLALLGIKIAVVPAILVIPLLPLTLLFAFFCSGVFTRPFQVLSLRAAVDLDEYRQARAPAPCAPLAHRRGVG